MNHAEATRYLDEFVEQQLDADLAARVAAHVESCTECRDLIATLRRMRAELLETGPTLLDAHPSIEDLAASLAAGEGPEPLRFARIRDHIAVCPLCAVEAAKLVPDDDDFESDTTARRPEPTSRLQSETRPARSVGWRIVIPALAAGLVAVAWPAFRSLRQQSRLEARIVELEDQLQQSNRNLEQEKSQLASALERERRRRDWGGAIRMLVLQPLRRGASDGGPSTLTLVAGQTAQPMVVMFDPFTRGDPAGHNRLVVQVYGPEKTAASWQYEASAAELWSRELQGLCLLVPASALRPGANRLEIRAPGGSDPLYMASFEVFPAP